MAVWRHSGWKLGPALLLLAALALCGQRALAQGWPRIDGVDVERVAALVPGTRLNFSVFGSPGGQVVVQIDGARHPLPLRELQPGVYDGSYRLEPGEHIAADARAVAVLRLGAQEVRAVLDEPLLLDAGLAALPRSAPGRPAEPVAPERSPPAPPTALPPPWSPAPPAAASPPPGPASAETPPTPPRAEWPAQPQPQPQPQAQPQQEPPPPAPVPAPAPVARPAAPTCPDCAIVESIRPLPADDRPPASAAGSLLGGLFGERVGQAVDRHVARVTGAVDRAVRGRPLDEPAGAGVEVVLRLPNGQRLLRIYERAPDLRAGDSVRRGTDLGGARSERLLGAPPASDRGLRPRGEQLAGSPSP